MPNGRNPAKSWKPSTVILIGCNLLSGCTGDFVNVVAPLRSKHAHHPNFALLFTLMSEWMATKMSRRTLNIPKEARSPSPQVSTSSSGRTRSNLSPTRITRIQEKVQLQNLNDRLAAYIDTVRNLENENCRLNSVIRTTQESTTKEVTNVKNCYEKELNEVRKVLDVTAKEKAKLQMAADKYRSETDDLRIK